VKPISCAIIPCSTDFSRINRNNKRLGKEKIPEIGIKSTYSKLETPSYKEGFEQMFYVSLQDGIFKISKLDK
jgi:hypothetical protein